MATRYSYLALADDQQAVLDWFTALPDEVTVSDRVDRIAFYFRAMAEQPLPPAGEIDPESMPLVIIEKPRRPFAGLVSDAEVCFSPTRLKSRFPALHRISSSFAKWLRQFELIFTQKNASSSEWSYFLEGSIQNLDVELHALPSAMAALKSGQYFVHYRDNIAKLETLAKKLKLRGYDINKAPID